MRKLAMTAAVCALLLLSAATAFAEVASVTIDELKAKLGDPSVIIVDSRSGSDWRGSEFKIQGVVRGETVSVAEWAAELEKTKEIIVYCA